MHINCVSCIFHYDEGLMYRTQGIASLVNAAYGQSERVHDEGGEVGWFFGWGEWWRGGGRGGQVVFQLIRDSKRCLLIIESYVTRIRFVYKYKYNDMKYITKIDTYPSCMCTCATMKQYLLRTKGQVGRTD